jgi:hypothetical protein
MPHKRSITGFHIRSAIRKPKDYQRKSKRTPPPLWLQSQAAKEGVPSDFEDEVMKKDRGTLVPFGQNTARRTVWRHVSKYLGAQNKVSELGFTFKVLIGLGVLFLGGLATNSENHPPTSA